MKRLVWILKWLIGLGLVAGLAVAAFLPQPTGVEVAAVSRGPLEETVREDGMTRVRERYTVSSPVAGRLARIRLKPGDRVSSGQTVLAWIEPSDPSLLDSRQLAQSEARVAAAEAAMERADAAWTLAEAGFRRASEKLNRSEELFRNRAISIEELEVDRSAATIAREAQRMAGYDQEVARFELEQYRAAVKHVQAGTSGPVQPPFEIRSPVPGVVLRVLQESATVVAPGTPLLEVGEISDLEIVADVLSTDAVRIQPGSQLRLEQWGGSHPLPARVIKVEPSAFTRISALGVEEQRVNVIAELERPEETTALGDGYRVEAVIVTWNHPDVLQVPSGALFREQGKWSVFRVVDEVTELVAVEIGHRGETTVEVLSGLQEGERVLLYPGDLMKAGTWVRVEESAGAVNGEDRPQ